MTEEKRRERSVEPPDIEEWNRKMQTVRLFDSLIRNTDRNAGNLLIDARWKLWMIDHSRAFRRDKKIPEVPGFAQCDRDLFQALQELDLETARTRLKPYLRKYEIDAILKRRDGLVTYIEGLLAERGSDQVLFSLCSGR